MVYEEPTLSDYALIGNSCSAALVSKHGSIDWCCLPEFHSASVFAALLDRKKGGYFSIAPVEESQSIQQYLPDTNVAETHFTTHAGAARITDAFTAVHEETRKLSLFPDHEILRIVEGVSGAMRMKLDYSPKIFYGRDTPVLEDRKKLGIHFAWKENIFILLTTLDPDTIRIEYSAGRAIAEFTVKQGERLIFSFSYSNQSPAVLPELKETAWTRMQQTIHYWRKWISKINYAGVYENAVKRSALVLKLLAHAPSGSIIAAPTTSLPEMPGGKRNWDYRFCWLRDASFTIRVLVKLGFEEEAHAYMNWILHATQLTRPKLQVLYSVYGDSRLKEKTIDWLCGYKNSQPVRIGNKAGGQFQLDIYGEVLDAIYSYAPLVKEFDRNSKKFITGLGEVICNLWNKPDNGIWETRSSPVHHTHSKVMAWAGLDRLIKLCVKYEWKDVAMKKFRETAVAIRNNIEQHGYNAALASYTREFNGDTVDASLLILPLVDYCDASSGRMVSTTQLVCEQLAKNNLIYRYRDVNDGLAGDEGSFVVCSFWLAENLAKSGKVKEAIIVFEAALKHASPTGLLSEEIDPESHDLLGNYPQGFSHIGLINAALSINEENNKRPGK
jgi:GH15 family glucan-1,4-alpha-glucosidase